MRGTNTDQTRDRPRGCGVADNASRASSMQMFMSSRTPYVENPYIHICHTTLLAAVNNEPLGLGDVRLTHAQSLWLCVNPLRATCNQA